MDTVLFLLLTFPLTGALILTLTGRFLSRRAVETIACASVIAAFVLALTALVLSGQKTHALNLGSWFGSGTFQVDIDLYYDPLAALMALMVTFVSGIVHIYSIFYMRDESDHVRYFCFLNLFVFAMLVIVTAGNLVFIYLGWEIVGLCSYALIGFWYQKPEAANAGRKAFVATRLADVAFGAAIALCWINFGHLSVSGIQDGAASLGSGAATMIGFLLLFAAIGKSAQLPLSVWLPDAMAGPTPVSALIHAATMVTAGVYLLMRFFPVIQCSQIVLFAISLVGVMTVCFGAFSALVQRDIKRILAYSTISQVGYMFLALGAQDLAGSMFHLITHAFFKALLFLAAGCIIQALHEEHDIFLMEGLRRKLPLVFWFFMAGVLCLGAFPGSGGFFSKDRILLSVFLQPEAYFRIFWIIASIAAMITPLYAFRMFFVIFYAKSETDRNKSAPIPDLMVMTILPLAILSVAAGFINLPANWGGSEWLARFLQLVPEASARLHPSSQLEWAMQAGFGLITIAMVILAWVLYARQDIDERHPAAITEAIQNLFLNGFYLDHFYQRRIVIPYRNFADFLWKKVDEGLIDDRLDRKAIFFMRLAERLRLWTTGQIPDYVTMMVAGFAIILFGFSALWWIK